MVFVQKSREPLLPHRLLLHGQRNCAAYHLPVQQQRLTNEGGVLVLAGQHCKLDVALQEWARPPPVGQNVDTLNSLYARYNHLPHTLVHSARAHGPAQLPFPRTRP